MSLRNIATENLIVEITPSSGASWAPGEPEYNKVLSDKVRACGHRVLVDEISWVMPSEECVLESYTHNGGLSSQKITASSLKVRVEGEPVILQNDNGRCTGSFSQGQTVVMCTCDFEIVDAGQNKVRGK